MAIQNFPTIWMFFWRLSIDWFFHTTHYKVRSAQKSIFINSLC
jgi:hypothetical protein